MAKGQEEAVRAETQEAANLLADLRAQVPGAFERAVVKSECCSVVRWLWFGRGGYFLVGAF